MKKLSLSFLFTVLISHTFATTLHEQLCAFNFNWENYPQTVDQLEAIDFHSDKDYVATHLTFVIPILKANTPVGLSLEQLTKRKQLIQVLDEYRLAGNFPLNYYRQERIPVFIDEHNTHCAVGYLLKETGYGEVAKRIATTDNYAWVKDIQDPALLPWQLYSGFTLDELKLIQGAYDFYMPGAFTAPNKYEIPQKPEVVTAYFENVDSPSKSDKLWCYGEEKDGVLHGRWEQNHSTKLPWILGFFDHGKRTGQWKEYYQGTEQLCRTENWRNDKLNGIRKRFNRMGALIEEILFKDGVAITKINYDLQGDLRWVRKPLDSNLVWTEVYTLGGGLLAEGHELVYNPGNLQWFQNIELTALNTFAITSRDMGAQITTGNLFSTSGGSSGGQQLGLFQSTSQYQPSRRQPFNSGPALVTYKKVGDWMYYHEFNPAEEPELTANATQELMLHNYKHFGPELYQYIERYEELQLTSAYDSILVKYVDNEVVHFLGFGLKNYTHLEFIYHDNLIGLAGGYYGSSWQNAHFGKRTIAAIGQRNENNEKIGIWKHYNFKSQLYKVETYMIPWRDENEEVTVADQP